MNETFEEKEEKVISRSVAYNSSSAFVKALDYIAGHNPSLYKKLIELEYNEAFG